MKCMSIDLGEVRIGIAVSDSMGIIANGLETYNRKNLKADVEYMIKIIKDYNIKCCVLGLPINMNGTEGPRVEKSREFGSLIDERLKDENIDCKIDYQDERLTTVSSERVLIESGMRRDKRKTVIDKIAATIILQTYLDCHPN